MQFVPHKIYLKLFPVVVKLAVDVEPVAQQLYAPLVKQLIHWLTNNTKGENKETMALLDTLSESLCNPTDGALREYSAECIAEFFKWSVKQSANNPVHDFYIFLLFCNMFVTAYTSPISSLHAHIVLTLTLTVVF